MARIRSPSPPRTSAEALRALRLPDLEASLGGPRDCRVWASVRLGRDGKILLEPLKPSRSETPPGYSACLRRFLRVLRRNGFPAELVNPRRARLKANRYRIL
ncbi:MAG: hypothetical protein GX430_09395 [Treponema sp.]|nr:hypothetical protein [Treponema sp.]